MVSHRSARILGAVFVLVASMATGAVPARASQFMSLVNLAVDSGAQSVSGEANSGLIVGKVGVPMRAHVTLDVGWHDCPAQGGTCVLRKNNIPNPEYELFSQGVSLPPGLYFDTATGVLSGTPLAAGRWDGFSPAARDLNRKLYLGNGYWWTQTVNYNGKVYSETKQPYAIVIDPAVSSAITLNCTSSDAANFPVTLELDYAIATVSLNRPTLPARLKMVVSDSTLSWKDPSYADGSSVLDRGTGILVVSKGMGMNGQWLCTKHTVNQF